MRKLRLTRPNMSGRDVLFLKKRLLFHRLDVNRDPEWPSNPIFDSETWRLVRTFQAMAGLPQIGDVDEVTWNALVNMSERVISLPEDWQLNSLIQSALNLESTPYITGSSDPAIGVDSVGFLLCVMQRAFGVPIRNTSVLEIFNKVPDTFTAFGGPPERGGWVFYGDIDVPHHVMFQLNKQQVIGAVGGNNATRDRLMALRRDARVKIKPLHYREKIVGWRDSLNIERFLRG